MRVLLVMLSCWAILGQTLSPSANLSDQDRARLKAIFAKGLGQDIGSVHYAVLGYALLGEGAAVPDKERLCALAAQQADDASLEVLYAAAGAAAALRCPIKLGPKAAEVVKTNLGEGSNPASLYFAANALTATGGKLEAAALKVALQAALKKDDSLLNMGLAFHVAAMLDGDLSTFVERVEDALVQADEVDGRLLQFEGGLSVTSVVLTGAAALAQKAKKPLPLTGDQMVKFANYLMSRRSVQQVKGAVHLLEAVEVMVTNGQAVPLVVALHGGPAAVSRDRPSLTLAITDVKGGNPGELKVVLDSATLTKDGRAVASSQQLKKVAGSSDSLYQIDLMAHSPPSGFYELQLTATPLKGASKFVGNTGVVLPVRVLTTMSVKDVKLQILDSDQSSSRRTFELNYPGQLGQKLPVDHKETIQMTFAVVNSEKENFLPHQAFVRLTHKATKSEIVYIAEADASKLYKFELDLGGQLDEFKSKSGDYSLTLLLGDALTANSVAWTVGDLEVKLPEEEAGANKEPGIYEPKPEIRHLFREPEARPSMLVSNAFTVLVLSPLLLLLACWAKLGVNVANFPFSLSGLGFHAGLGAIFMLYLYFWLQLNMFETIKYLVVVGVVTFLCGNSLLANIAKKNK